MLCACGMCRGGVVRWTRRDIFISFTKTDKNGALFRIGIIHHVLQVLFGFVNKIICIKKPHLIHRRCGNGVCNVCTASDKWVTDS